MEKAFKLAFGVCLTHRENDGERWRWNCTMR